MQHTFKGINCVGITKPIYDVKVFKLLFYLCGELPYLTNSCNFEKPWCGKCTKCIYVFAGFAAFGDYKKSVDMFGSDSFKDESLLLYWEELLGLKDYLTWECIGHPEELQLYFYKLYNQGVTGCAIDLFHEKILINLQDSKAYFQQLELKYSKVYSDHHLMPNWLWNKVEKIF
ncbi:MAG TPA: hypothetical protein C5S51_00540 [Methanosarcinaceae archaeon]|nr:hypothetical protein [Methanosarcinaceae archaeon]